MVSGSSQRRRVFDNGDRPSCVLVSGGTTHRGAIRRVEGASIFVECATSVAEAFAGAATLSEVAILGTAGTTVSLGVLEVVSTGDGINGVRVVQLRAMTEASRAALWLMAEKGRGPDAGALESNEGTDPGVGAIPARGKYSKSARLERLAYIRELTGEDLRSLESTTLVPRRLTGNIENLVASVEVPVGLAGPLLFEGEHARGIVHAPLATTEGTLVASATRGARALTRSGGVHTRVLAQRMMRVPLFILSSLSGAVLFSRWVRDHAAAIAAQVRQVSGFAELVSVEPHLVGRHVHLPFVFETGDAAGQNMTTSCTYHACQWILAQMEHFDEIAVENFIVEANMSGDKKVNFNSFLMGRGTRAVAEATLDRRTVEEVLKVTPEQLDIANRAFMTGSAQVGMVGYNINVANIVAAIFMATGQDVGSAHESSLGQLQLELVGDAIRVSMLMPSLIVGTVGGGTHLPRQRDLLAIMGCDGPGKVKRLAEIIVGYALALDISTLAAIAGGQFAQAHERLGRNRPVKWLQRGDLNPALMQPGLRRSLDDADLVVESVDALDGVEMGSSIITELTARKVRKLVGLFPLRVALRDSAGVRKSVEVVAKVKPLDDEVIMMLNSMAAMCGPGVADTFARYKGRTIFAGCDVRELAVYEQTDPRFVRHAPRAHLVYRDDAREAYVLALERLADVDLLDSADDVAGWSPKHIEAALAGIAEVHSVWFGRTDELRSKPWIGRVMDGREMVAMHDLWEALGRHAHREFPALVNAGDLGAFLELTHTLEDWWPELETHPMTLIHNDFNPRNICFRPTSSGPQLCAYDWELATIHLPQHDAAELLAFVLGPEVESAELDAYVALFRRRLSAATGTEFEAVSFRRGFDLCLRDLLVNRFALYLMAHTFRHYGFLARALKTLRRLIELSVVRGGS